MASGTVGKAELVNMALVELGQPPKFSIDSGTSLGGTVDLVFQRVVDHCFGIHDWSFCRRTDRLARQAETPVNGWDYGFSLPGERLGPPLKVLRDPGPPGTILRDFDIEGDTLYAREPAVWTRCKVHRDPEAWDPDWRAAFVIALASGLAVPLQQDFEAREAHRVEAFGTRSEGGTGGLFGRLIAQDRAGAPVGSPMQYDDPLTGARWG